MYENIKENIRNEKNPKKVAKLAKQLFKEFWKQEKDDCGGEVDSFDRPIKPKKRYIYSKLTDILGENGFNELATKYALKMVKAEMRESRVCRSYPKAIEYLLKIGDTKTSSKIAMKAWRHDQDSLDSSVAERRKVLGRGWKELCPTYTSVQIRDIVSNREPFTDLDTKPYLNKLGELYEKYGYYELASKEYLKTFELNRLTKLSEKMTKEMNSTLIDSLVDMAKDLTHKRVSIFLEACNRGLKENYYRSMPKDHLVDYALGNLRSLDESILKICECLERFSSKNTNQNLEQRLKNLKMMRTNDLHKSGPIVRMLKKLYQIDRMNDVTEETAKDYYKHLEKSIKEYQAR